METTADGSSALVCLVTFPDEETGRRIGRLLVEEHLAACVNLVPGVRSIYEWKGTISDDAEVLGLIKTEAARFEAMRARLVALHPYEVPEVIALPVAAGHAPYLAWLAAAVRPT